MEGLSLSWKHEKKMDLVVARKKNPKTVNETLEKRGLIRGKLKKNKIKRERERERERERGRDREIEIERGRDREIEREAEIER